MKLVTFIRQNETEEEVGVLREDHVLPLRELGFPYATMNELILRAGPEERAAMAAAEPAVPAPTITMSAE